eukprot:Unigene6436_Nuclearia_a/m.19827 Unigene6436_Nuclearia_a/g.19827  ORF Unigene6436_Nuclearia_a/g.19827 Unigene6436_Nuclearia_a/m.19827 type:complete len:317 (-) Unigene6436_Nuclearia_a:46-996(-)
MAHNSWSTSVSQKGEYVRKDSVFRDFVRADGSTPFAPEAGRYHLYVSLACPWACRTLAVRELKGLQDAISVTVVDWLLEAGGWKFTDQKAGCSLDPIFGEQYLRAIYTHADPNYAGNITVPVLFDRKHMTIVNNESSEIIRMLNSEFNAIAKNPTLDLYPAALRDNIDAVNEWVYPSINNGVYRCGFARSQEAYDEAFTQLFASLDRVEGILGRQRYLAGNQLTEADVRLFTTLIRFDAVYVLHFKCNQRRIQDYPNMQNYLKELYQMDAFRCTVDFEHIKNHYMQSHKHINPAGIVARGPLLDLDSPHDRTKFAS